jgi:hypothetical protein
VSASGGRAHYEIRVDGVLDSRWAAWFDGLQVSDDGEETVISGLLADQPALQAPDRGRGRRTRAGIAGNRLPVLPHPGITAPGRRQRGSPGAAGEELVASFSTDDPAQRLAALAGAFTQAILSDEALIRTGIRVYMDTWLANQRNGSHIPVRAGRRMRYIDEVLRPLGERLSEPGRNQLRSALAVILGTEAVIAMKDSAGLDDDEEIIATLQWAAGALLRTALHDYETSP